MNKVALAPFYVSLAWVLMISYQLFTQTAVITVITSFNTFWPSALSSWLYLRAEMIIFIHAFAWVFLLSSVIPSILLRSNQSVLLQFFVCLSLTLVSVWIVDFLPLIAGSQIIDQIFSMSGLFYNPFFAGLYVLAPYLLMLLFDIQSRRKYQRVKKMLGLT